MIVEKLINVAGIGIGVAVVSAYNDHAAQTITGFFRSDPYGEVSRLFGRVLKEGHWYSEAMSSYAMDNVPMFCFAMVTVVLSAAMLKS
jgi:hypothetical protein